MNLQGTIEALGLEGKRFSVAHKANGNLVSECFSDVKKAEAWLSRQDAYICGNPVLPGVTGKPVDDDIAGDGILLVDCDPKKDPDLDPHGTGQASRDAAWNIAMQVWESFEQRGLLVDSGRGAQVWLRVQPGSHRRKLLSWIRDHFRDDLVEIDATYDVSRLMRLPGTINSRTGDEVIVVDPGHGVLSRAAIAETLEGWSEAADVELCEVDRNEPSRLEVRRYVHGKALALWSEDPMEITTDRSKRDFLFLTYLLENGAPLETASRLLHALPGAKAAERSDDAYWRSTASSAARRVELRKSEVEVLDTLVARANADPTVLVSDNAIKALGRLYLTQFNEWAKLRALLKPIAKRGGISLADIDKLVRSESKRINDADVGPPDHVVVYVRGEDGGKGSWKLRDSNGAWSWVSRIEAQIALENAGMDPIQGQGLAMDNPFTISSEPFKPRILPGRVWNESNARFAVAPKAGDHPTWDQLMRVVGRGLDKDLAASTWARKNGVETGGQYLTYWLGTMLTDPKSRRAYLFLYSREQGTGKSLFFESIKLLIGRAVVKANNALTNDRGFNGELQRAVLAYTEEVNLARDGGRGRVYNRVKDWSLSDTMSIEGKGATIFEVPNVISWGQCANDPGFCPIFEGDDRVTIYQVLPPREDEQMEKEVMRERLRREAPAFLHTLLNLKAPKGQGRYVVPPISTEAKRQQARASRDDLAVWLDATPEWVTMDDEALCDAFRDYLATRDLGRQFWPPQRILRSLPEIGDKAREVVLRLKGRQEGRWTPTEASKDFGLGSAKRAGSIMRQAVAGWDRLSEIRPQNRATFVLEPDKP